MLIFKIVHANNTTTSNICLYYNIELALWHNIQQLTLFNCYAVQVMVLNQTVHVSYNCYWCTQNVITSQNLHVAICYPSCGTNKECSAPNTCTCVSGWTGNDCLTGILTYIHLNSSYKPIITQQFAIHHVASANNVQLLTLVHVPVDGPAMIVQLVWLHIYPFELIIQSYKKFSNLQYTLWH